MTMWGYSLQFWQSVSYWTLIAAFIFGGLTVTTSFITGIVSYNLSDVIQSDANIRIANANEQTALLKVEAEKLRIQAAWRVISDDQLKALASVLNGHNFTVKFTYLSFDAETVNFASQVATLLKNSGINLETDTIIVGSAFPGISISGEPREERELLAAAFNKAGIPVSIGSSKEELNIIIGTKSPFYNLP